MTQEQQPRNEDSAPVQQTPAPTNKQEYILEASPTETERLRMQHDVVKDAVGGSLVAAPIDLTKPGLRILDSATADGHWLQDVYRDYSLGAREPCCTLLGTDIVPAYFPDADLLPPGMQLRVQSITKPWPQSDRNSFDLVHQRLGLYATGDKLPMAVAGLVDLVRPGGWIQLVDADLTGPEAHLDSPMASSIALVKTLFGKTDDVAHAYGSKLKLILEENGLVEVQEQVVDVRQGVLNPKPELAKMSTMSLVHATTGMVAAARNIPALAANFQLDDMASSLKKGLEEKGILFRYYVVWGQKPL